MPNNTPSTSKTSKANRESKSAKPVPAPLQSKSQPRAGRAAIKPTPTPLPTPDPELLLPKPGLAARSAWLPKAVRFGLWGLAGIVVLYIAGIGAIVYSTGTKQALVKQTAAIIPYPAALISFSPVSYENFADLEQALGNYFKALQGFNPSLTAPSNAELKAAALDELVRQQGLRRVANHYKIKVTNVEIDEQINKLVTQAGSKDSVKTTIADLYGWDLDHYRDRVIVPFLLRQDLQTQLAADNSLAVNQEAKKNAEAALAKLNGETDFSDLAKQVSEDETTKESGGEVGFVKKGDLDQALEQAVFALDAGKFTNVVQIPQGYVIALAEEKKAATTDSAGVTTGEEVKIRQILFKTADVDAYLTEQLKTHRIITLVRGVRWDSKQGHVVAK